MRYLRASLVADGAGDKALQPILEWLLAQHLSDWSVGFSWVDPHRIDLPRRPLRDRVIEAFRAFPCDLLFVHRDAERDSLAARRDEIQRACASITIDGALPAVVSVVPVRMTEAWRLFNDAAIRRAAGNPLGRQALNPPSLDRVEQLPNPKQDLLQLLLVASGIGGRRRKHVLQAPGPRIANLIDDFSPLRQLPAFQALERDLLDVIDRRGWR